LRQKKASEEVSKLGSVVSYNATESDPKYMYHLMDYYFNENFLINKNRLEDGYYFVVSDVVVLTDEDVHKIDMTLKGVHWRQLNSLHPKNNIGRMYADELSTKKIKKLPKSIQMFIQCVRNLLIRFEGNDRHVHGPSFIKLTNTVTGTQGWHIDNYVRFGDQTEVEPSYDNEKMATFSFQTCQNYRDFGYSFFLGLANMNSIQIGRVSKVCKRTIEDEGRVNFLRGSILVITDNKPHQGDCFIGDTQDKPSLKLFMSSNEFGCSSGNNFQRWFRGSCDDQYWLRTSVGVE